MKVAIYSRKSKYTGKGDSIGNQVQMCKDYIENLYKNKEITYSIYEDEGFSGKNTNRPQFQKFLQDLKKEKFDILICYRLDRISRNVADFSTTLETLQSYGTDFVSIKEQFDTTSPMGRAMIYIASVFAQLERETIAERVRDNMLEMAKNGQWLGGTPPLGYVRKMKECYDEHGNPKEIPFLEQNPDEIELVNTVYKVYLQQGSITKTEKYLMQNNIKTTSGGFFASSTLSKILKNPIYVKSTKEVMDFLNDDGWNVYGEPDSVHGILSYNKTSVIIKDGKKTNLLKNKDEWIATVSERCIGFIDAEKWLAVQEQLKTNKFKSPRLGKTNNALLTSKLRCANCGSPMGLLYGHIDKSTGLKKIYYKCTLKRRSGCTLCNSKNIAGDTLEKYVLDGIENIGKRKDELLDSLRIKNKENKKNNSLDLKKKSIEKNITDKERLLNGLVEKLAIADDLSDIFLDKIRNIKSEIATLEKDLMNLDVLLLSERSQEYDLKFIESLLDECVHIKELLLEDQKRLIDFLIEEIHFDSETDKTYIYPIGSIETKKKELAGI